MDENQRISAAALLLAALYRVRQNNPSGFTDLCIYAGVDPDGYFDALVSAGMVTVVGPRNAGLTAFGETVFTDGCLSIGIDPETGEPIVSQA